MRPLARLAALPLEPWLCFRAAVRGDRDAQNVLLSAVTLLVLTGYVGCHPLPVAPSSASAQCIEADEARDAGYAAGFTAGRAACPAAEPCPECPPAPPCPECDIAGAGETAVGAFLARIRLECRFGASIHESPLGADGEIKRRIEALWRYGYCR